MRGDERDEQCDRGEHQQTRSQAEQAGERAHERRAGDHPEVAARGDAADRERRMAGFVVDVGEQQRPHHRDADRRRREPGGRDSGRAAQRLGRDPDGRERGADDDGAPRAQRPDHRPAAEARDRGQPLSDDVGAHAREHAQAEVAAEIEDAPRRDAALDHRRRAEHEREDEQSFVAQAGERATSTDGRTAPVREAGPGASRCR